LSVAALAGPSPKRLPRRYGLPLDGYTSSVPAHVCPPGKLWGAQPSALRSYNLRYDPIEGKFFRRDGSLTVGGAGGILEAGPASMRARQMLELHSPTLEDLGDSYPTHCLLLSRESATAANNNAALYLYDTVGPQDYTLGMEFDATNHYPGTTAATMNIKCIPYMRTTDGLWGRLNSAAKRQYALAGSRRMLEIGKHLYFGNLHSLPMRWNKRYNRLTSSGSQNLQLAPTGGIVPMGAITLTGVGVNANGIWTVNDTFYYSVVYEYADGSFSFPMMPRPINSELTTGLHRHVVAASVDTLVWTNIPIGPSDVVARWLCRTPKKSTNAATGGSAEPEIKDLRPFDRIPNNTQTSYIDIYGNDLALSTRTDIVNFERQWPNPARHIWPFDGRIAMGYLNPHPAAILLCPNVNVDDDSASILTNKYEFDVGATTADKLTLYKDNVTDAASKIDISSSKTIQQMVDLINATTVAGAGGKWHAALVPGADGSAPASSLCGTSTAGTPAGPADIDVGDTSKRVRSFAASYPGIAYFGTAYLTAAERKGPYKGRWRFSEGGPQLAGSNFGDMWPAGNIRTGLESWGMLMGGAPLLDGCIIFFSKAIVLFRNIKSGRSGLDEDYHPDDLFTNLGCIAWDSIAYGDGWAGCLTSQGYMVFDGRSGQQGRATISGDVWNPATGQGEWAYEIAQSEASVGVDNDASHFHAKVMGGKLYITYRSNSAVNDGVCDRTLVYDFSGSVAGSGLAQVLRPDGTPWGWSPPNVMQVSVLGEVRKSAGIKRYGAIEANLGTTNGRIDQTEVSGAPAQDNGVNIDCGAWFCEDLAEEMRKKRAQQAWVVYKCNGTGMKFHFRRTNGSSSVTETGGGLPLPSTGSGTFSRTRVPLPQNARAPAVGNQIRLSEDGTATTPPEVWGAELDEVITASYD